jgi:hypothetical protein
MEERPPPTLLIATAIQHVGVLVMFLIYPLLVAKQGLPAGPVGSRFLAPSIFTGVFLAPSLMAVKAGNGALNSASTAISTPTLNQTLKYAEKAASTTSHTISPYLIVPHDGQQAAVQDADLLAKHSPDNQHRFDQPQPDSIGLLAGNPRTTFPWQA